MFSEYQSLFVVILISLLLSIFVFFLSFIAIVKTPSIEKLSIYECGFDPFETVHINFEIRYFLVSLLFMVFDMEVSFLFPWAVLDVYDERISLFLLFFFLIFLTVGFLYEWIEGGLEWH